MPRQRSYFIERTTWLLGVGFLVLASIVSMTFWLSLRSQALYDEVVAARDARAAAAELRNELLAAESNARGYLVSGNEIYLSPYERSKARVGRQAQIVAERFAGYGEVAPSLGRLDEVIAQLSVEMDTVVGFKRRDQDAEAAARFATNRGKALMDEANVFLSGLARAADTRLTISAGAQGENANWLRWVSMLGGVIVVVAVGAAALAILQYAAQLRQARDDVSALNAGLEVKVAERTEELLKARERAELLLAEVNHRVANSLSLVSSLVKLQAHTISDQQAKQALEETQARLLAVAMIHKSLYTSGDVRSVALDVYLAALMDQLRASLADDRRKLRLIYDIAPIRLPVDTSVNLGVVATEWVTNAIKYAYPNGEGDISIRLGPLAQDSLELSVEDHGIGRQDERPKGTGLGTRIVSAMAASMNGRIEYTPRQPGTRARMILPLKAA